MNTERICEGCEKNKSEMLVNMPLSQGLFTANLCMNCGFIIHESSELFIKIINKRAKERNILLPCSNEDFKILLVGLK